MKRLDIIEDHVCMHTPDLQETGRGRYVTYETAQKLAKACRLMGYAEMHQVRYAATWSLGVAIGDAEMKTTAPLFRIAANKLRDQAVKLYKEAMEG